MSKAIATQILKDYGLKLVKMSSGSMSHVTKTYLDHNGKRVSGIRVSSTGPLTCTDAHLIKQAEVMQKVKAALVQQFATIDDSFVVERTKRSTTFLRLHISDFPAYTRSANLDPGYRNQYIVPVFEKVTD